ncbi:MAG: ATP-binding cassette domain-containing protein [Kangiellaceae bacterium]
MQLAIEVSNLSKQFEQKFVLENININVPQGSVYGFLGNNGAGKSTLIRILLGLLNIDSGVVKIDSKAISRTDVAYKNAIGCLVDSPCLYTQLTAKEYLAISCKIKGLAHSAIDEALEIVNMSEHLNVPMDNFSLGMKQRIALANALLGQPKLLILDEPTNGLDPAGMREIRHLLKSLPERSGATVFLSSHLLDEIQKTATHVGILHQGKMAIESNLKELMHKQSASLDIITPFAQKLNQYFIQQDIPSQIISSKQLRLNEISYSQCSEITQQVVNAGFELIEARFNQASLENLFLQLVQNQSKEGK